MQKGKQYKYKMYLMDTTSAVTKSKKKNTKQKNDEKKTTKKHTQKKYRMKKYEMEIDFQCNVIYTFVLYTCKCMINISFTKMLFYR